MPTLSVVASRLGALCVVLAGLATPALAAEITDVADAADVVMIGKSSREDPFDLYFGTEFAAMWSNGTIAREPIDRADAAIATCTEQQPRACIPMNEMRWKRAVYVQTIRAQVGIFHDLAFTLDLPLVFSDVLKFSYAGGVGPENSTIDSGDPNSRLFANNFSSKHKGLGPMDVGLRFAPLSDERDESKPSWVLSFKWSMPWTAQTYRLRKPATDADPAPVGDGMHRLTFGMAFSKRLAHFGAADPEINPTRRGYMDPYFEVTYSLPIPQKGRALPDFIRSDDNPFGTRPSQVARFAAGVEVVPYEDLAVGRRVAIDVGLRAAYFGEGRNYTVITDALREVTLTEQYINITPQLGIYVQPVEFLRIHTGISFGVNNEHFLTNETVGDDKNEDGQVLRPEEDSSDVKDVINPYYNDKHDQVGFRFRNQRQTTFTSMTSLIFTL